MRPSRIILSSFLDGFTMAGLFTRLPRPGAATQVFADPQPEDSVSTPDWSPGGERTDDFSQPTRPGNTAKDR
jgi:hypothetical protein